MSQSGINKTRDSAREDEIAAKISALRRRRTSTEKKKPEQLGDNPTKNEQSIENGDNSFDSGIVSGARVDGLNIVNGEELDERSVPKRFDELPDWKKEEMLLKQMDEAEKFLKTSPVDGVEERKTEGSTLTKGEGKTTDGEYKPRVSTWGVYPRPDNISRAYGGGRKITEGGVNLQSTECQKRDARVSQMLAAFRTSPDGTNKADEEEVHADEITRAVERAEQLMRETRTKEAIDELELVEKYINEKSLKGGQFLLTLAMAYESIGKRQMAKQIYVRLKRSPFKDISSSATNLYRGFADMQTLRFDNVDNIDDNSSEGIPVLNFVLPDVAAAATDRRYETVISVNSNNTKDGNDEVSLAMNLAIGTVMIAPFILLFLFITLRHH